jgi:hypothetical protein
MQRPAFYLSLVLAVLPAAAVAADQPRITALECAVRDAGGGAATLSMPDEPLFVWPQQVDLDAELSLALEGFSGSRKVSVFAVLFEDPRDGPPVDKHDQQVLAKLKGTHNLNAGSQRLAFPALWHTDERPGRHRYRLDVEADLKGAKAAQRSIWFETQGPPPPEVEIISAEAWNPNGSRENSNFQPGDPLALNVLFEVRGNQARHGPVFAITALMDEDRYSDDDLRVTPYGEVNRDRRQLTAEDGEYQLTVRGLLPAFYSEPWNTRHPFSIRLEVDTGSGAPTVTTLNLSINDYYPGDARRTPDLAPRLIQLDRALRWDLRLQRPAVKI